MKNNNNKKTNGETVLMEEHMPIDNKHWENLHLSSFNESERMDITEYLLYLSPLS